MNDKKKRRFPKDRERLHQLLEKREREFLDRQEELEELRAAVIEADHTAIHATVEAYHVSPEQLHQILEAFRGGDTVPDDLLSELEPIAAENSNEDKEDEDDEEDIMHDDEYETE